MCRIRDALLIGFCIAIVVVIARLAAALRIITTNTDMRTSTETLADRIAVENGVENGISAIDTIARRFDSRVE